MEKDGHQCGKQTAGKNVTNLMNHLKFNHPDTYKVVSDANKAITTTNAVATAEGAGCPVGIPDKLFNLLQPPAVNCLITDQANQSKFELLFF